MAGEDANLRRAMVRMGYAVERESGKHRIWRHAVNGARVVMPKTVGRGRAYANCVSLARRLAK